MTSGSNKQESLWRGEFGDHYTDRNAVSDRHLSSLTKQWAQILRSTDGAPPQSFAEVGANIGLNLRALRRLTQANFTAIEPNAKARQRLIDDQVVPASNVHDGLCSALPLADGSVDLSFTSGVLIHIHPDQLLASVREIYRVSRRYIVCIEYFADKPSELLYREHTEALFKRDFGGYFMDQFPDLRLLDYGFSWKRQTGLDNLTWWIFEKA